MYKRCIKDYDILEAVFHRSSIKKRFWKIFSKFAGVFSNKVKPYSHNFIVGHLCASASDISHSLTLWITFQNGQTHLKDLVAFTARLLKAFKDHFETSCIKVACVVKIRLVFYGLILLQFDNTN